MEILRCLSNHRLDTEMLGVHLVSVFTILKDRRLSLRKCIGHLNVVKKLKKMYSYYN